MHRTTYHHRAKALLAYVSRPDFNIHDDEQLAEADAKYYLAMAARRAEHAAKVYNASRDMAELEAV